MNNSKIKPVNDLFHYTKKSKFINEIDYIGSITKSDKTSSYICSKWDMNKNRSNIKEKSQNFNNFTIYDFSLEFLDEKCQNYPF